MTEPMKRQDSLIIKVAHFKNLNPTPVAEALHRALSEEFGPILATATLRLASDRARLPIDKLSVEDARIILPAVVDSLKGYRTAPQLEELRALLAHAIDSAGPA